MTIWLTSHHHGVGMLLSTQRVPKLRITMPLSSFEGEWPIGEKMLVFGCWIWYDHNTWPICVRLLSMLIRSISYIPRYEHD